MALYEYNTLTGTIIPDTGDLLTQVENEYKAAFGQDLIVTPDTPQGVLIAAEVLARDAVLRNNAIIANLLNPNLAGGIALDAIYALTGGQRNAQTYSQVTVALAGVPGVSIPLDTVITDPNNLTNTFQNTSVVVLDPTGNTTSVFQSVNAGAVLAAANTLTKIINGPLGLETVNNPAASTVGAVTQSDLSARAERKVTLALQGISISEAIVSALNEIPGVTSLTFRENYLNTTQTINGVVMSPNSIYVCVAGGLDNAIAAVMQLKKTAGGNYSSGAATPVTVNVTDPISGQVIPVSFDRPALITIGVQVSVRLTNTAIDAQTAVKQAILDYAAGLLDQEVGFVVGGSVSSFELAGAVNREYPSVYVQDLKIAILSGTPSYQYGEIAIAIYQQAIITSSSIQVTIL